MKCFFQLGERGRGDRRGMGSETQSAHNLFMAWLLRHLHAAFSCSSMRANTTGTAMTSARSKEVEEEGQDVLCQQFRCSRGEWFPPRLDRPSFPSAAPWAGAHSPAICPRVSAATSHTSLTFTYRTAGVSRGCAQPLAGDLGSSSPHCQAGDAWLCLRFRIALAPHCS